MFTNLFISLNTRTMTAEVLTTKPEGAVSVKVHPVKEVMVQIGRAVADLSTGKMRVNVTPGYGAVITSTDDASYRALVRLNGGKHYEVFILYPRRDGNGVARVNPTTGEVLYKEVLHPRIIEVRRYMAACGISPHYAVTKHVAMAAWAAGFVLEVDMTNANLGTTPNLPLWIRKGMRAELDYIAKNAASAPEAAPEETQEMPQAPEIPQPEDAPAQRTPKLDVNIEMGVRTTELNAVRLLLTTENPDDLPAWAKARIRHAESKGRMPNLIAYVAQEMAYMEVGE
jgi:hypothetical protein